MGKYIRKARPAAEAAVMESPLGVRTRAKTIALRRLHNSGGAPSAATSGSYLQLRSRRLEKPPIHAIRHETRRCNQNQSRSPREGCMKNPNPKSCPNSGSRENSRLRDLSADRAVEETAENANTDLGAEASVGENGFEFESREISRRETTPCNLIRDLDTVRTPGSTPHPPSSNLRIENSTRRIVPAAHEVNEFFSGVEEQQQRLFIEKYNFDLVNDKPLPGQFQWEKVCP